MLKVDPRKVFSAEESENERSRILSVLLDSIKQVKETEIGFSLRLGTNVEDMILASEWIQVERLCNPFLRFTLVVESNGGPVSLEIGGPSGTKDFLSTELALSRWAL